MKSILVKSLICSFLADTLFFLIRYIFKTDLFVSDIGGINNFFAMFGTLYGILTAFVVFEVWNEYNSTVTLIDKEALGVEQLYRFIRYFRDQKLEKEMKKAIKKYVNEVITVEFPKLSEQKRCPTAAKYFREIFHLIRDIRFDDNHDQVAFDHTVGHYKLLSEIRTERNNQSLTRLPMLLKSFLYLSSFFALLVFLLMPFTNMFYGFLTLGILAFILGMVFQLIEDLDNPFVGYWNISPEPFERTMKHIEEDY